MAVSIVGWIVAGLFAAIGIGLSNHTHTQRWEVKTIADHFVVPEQAVRTTIGEQHAIPDIHSSSDMSRHRSERTLYVLDARLVEAFTEPDGDYHLIIEEQGTGKQMIVEIPSDEAGRAYLEHYRKARRVIRSLMPGINNRPTILENPPLIEVTGVGFFDEAHIIPQKGMSPNNREIHPVLSIRILEPGRTQ